ncbi:MAG: HlyD family efflux transporter periplasmic adaptor subunit [Deltaproteobacteria bacterium]|nr:HlyD family efflux transporter periplasmic adaptor subunit [Deltaproteobacteria bacterium]
MEEEQPKGKPKRKPAGKTVAATVMVIGVLALLFMAVRFIRYRMAYAVTDAVFVRTDSLVTIGFDRVNGRLAVMNKKEGDAVRRGEVLAAIDPAVYRLRVKRLTAELAEARQDKEGLGILLDRLRQETKLNEAIAAGRIEELSRQRASLLAQAEAIQAEIEQLARDRKRLETLYKVKAVSRTRAETIDTDLVSKQKMKKSVEEQARAVEASMATAGNRVKLARTGRLRIPETEKKIQALADKIKGLAAALATAQNDLGNCELKSPINGRVAKRFLTVGSIVSPKKAVLSLIDPRDVYIVALLEEGKLHGVERGAAVNISIDAYPDQKFRGRVEDILPATAATFALAPRDISAGEFTKVAQRIPVRISITSGDTSLLRVGLGGEVEIKRQ